MCGLCGYLSIDGTDLPAPASTAMLDAIAHRGPDSTGRFTEPGLFIGMNRLAIVDPEGGRQPIVNEEGTLRIVYNGEIYNHAEIRRDLERKGHRFNSRSDTEAVLHAFEEYGERCVERFNGMFAFAIWDSRARRLFLARDRLGIKPLYYSQTGAGFFFGSEAKAILAARPSAPEPDWAALYRYFLIGFLPGADTPFADIHKLPAGHTLWADAGSVRIQRYWEPSYGEGPHGSTDELLDRMRAAVEAEMMSDVPVGLFLSGGLDSSAVALLAGDNGRRRLKSFALKFEEASHDESADARIVAEHLGLEHHEFRFSAGDLEETLLRVGTVLDEPFGDATVLPLLALSERAREHVKVVLTGWGGDEIFAGYPTYRAHRLARWYRRLPALLGERLIPGVVNRLPVSDKYMSLEFKAKRFVKGMDLSPELQHLHWIGYSDDAQIRQLFRPELLEQVGPDPWGPIREACEAIPESDPVSRIQHLDARFFLEGNGLFQADRMTMAASLEARVPLLNTELTAFVNPMPSSLKMPGGEPKGLLKKILAPHLPERIIAKPKKGFGPPASQWLRGPLAKMLAERLAPDRIEADGLFQAKTIGRMIDEHQRRKADHGRRLWALLSFQIWHDNYIKQSRPCYV